MGKTALLFSGQGSQYEGMGLDLCESYPIAKEIYQKASEMFGFSVEEESKTGEHFAMTGYSQPCVFTLSMAVFSVLKEKGFSFDGVCGFSLGECAALYAADILSLEDTLRMVKVRSDAMQKASETANGAMSAVLGLQVSEIETVLQTIDGFVVPVNYNCEGQTVIAGEISAIEEAEVKLKEAGAKRCVRLAVSSAFHTKFMKDAGEELKNAVKELTVYPPKKEFYTNITGEKLNEITDLGEHLKTQMTNPVQFQKEIEAMIAAGYDRFIEIGPGKTLCGFVKRISREVTILNAENTQTLEQLLSV